MLFPAMVWIVTTGSGPASKAKAEKLAHSGVHHTQFPVDRLQSFVVGLSQSDGPWGEPPLTEESGPLKRTTSPENYSSIQSIKQVDERMVRALWQRLAPDDDTIAVTVQATGDVMVEKRALREMRPVVFTLRQSHGGRTVRPESVMELNDTDNVIATGPGTPSMVVADKCSYQFGDNSAEALSVSR